MFSSNVIIQASVFLAGEFQLTSLEAALHGAKSAASALPTINGPHNGPGEPESMCSANVYREERGSNQPRHCLLVKGSHSDKKYTLRLEAKE